MPDIYRFVSETDMAQLERSVNAKSQAIVSLSAELDRAADTVARSLIGIAQLSAALNDAACVMQEMASGYHIRPDSLLPHAWLVLSQQKAARYYAAARAATEAAWNLPNDEADRHAPNNL